MCGVRYWDATHTKNDQHCRAEDCFAVDMEIYDLPQEFTDKAILSLRKRL